MHLKTSKQNPIKSSYMLHVDNNSWIDPAASCSVSGRYSFLAVAAVLISLRLAERSPQALCANEELIYERHGRLGGGLGGAARAQPRSH